MQIVLAQTRGFCAGVTRAIEIVERALAIHGAPVYVFHEIVHNGHVVEDLERQGAIFVDDIDSIPRGAVTVFSAHGVAAEVERQARQRQLEVIDATCPLVAKCTGTRSASCGWAAGGHDRPRRSRRGRRHRGQGQRYRPPREQPRRRRGAAAAAEHGIAYVTQTTLSLDDTRDIIAALASRYPDRGARTRRHLLRDPQPPAGGERSLATSTSCWWSAPRNSSNSNRLHEVAEHGGCAAHLVADAGDIEPDWLAGANRVGVTAGASAPEYLVAGVIRRLRELGASSEIELGSVVENVSFRLPAAVLRRHLRRTAEAMPQHAYAGVP